MDTRVLPAVHLTTTVRWLWAAGLCALLGLAACRPQPVPGSPGEEGSPAPAAAFAIWPEGTPEAAAAAERLAAGADPWRGDPVETALAFAREVLGWGEPEVGRVEEQPMGLTLVEVRREPGGPAVSVRVGQLVGDRWWSVDNAWGSPEHDPTVWVRDRVFELAFDLEDARNATVVVEYGDLRIEREVEHGGPLRLDLGESPHVPGYFLVLLRDGRGAVFDVVSSRLPAGDFAAG